MRKTPKILINSLLLMGLLFYTGSCKKDEVEPSNAFTDPRDGNVYKTVKIGNQVWMAENLRYLPDVIGPGTGSNTTPYYYVYGYNGTNVADAKAISNYSIYGVLYNWTAAKNACPTGWHLPSDAEWTQLTDYLGEANIAGIVGSKLKEAGTSHWQSPNSYASNESGFTALPSGYRDLNVIGVFYYIGNNGYWWSATEYGIDGARFLGLLYNSSEVYRDGTFKELGFSVRCVKD